ncbi:MAG TPA: glyoxalase/bleomycin resistance/extradiol dioxygenase family protein [Cytophagales bacterium]|nr:glyoxalase/bleomycin resistance/extradiol dioxygenase family protein [Cytophagales bacterium]HAA22522.1 glyoxalase/bleomycin resistance/extradiol dioxygenase family protein [Cytophagales bacterium]HAP61392.1 glyoxalase/bleomycin resistance/extradiol dioxygenase family protein [Cytophagales bacterium]
MNLNQITVPSRDLSVAIPFYQKLGFKLIVHAGADYARFIVPDGEATFSLHRVEELPSGDGVWVYFECDNLEEEVARLEQEGVNFTLPPTDQSWLWREARLQDPDGNKIILYHAGENRKNPPWRLDT